MGEPKASTSQIIRWEILPGLPGEGPVPKHFHLGHPTPWAEGFVVRFWNEDGIEWVGNFNKGVTPFGSVLDFSEAEIIVVIASGACYFVPKTEPERYTTFGSGVKGALFDERRTLLILAHAGGDLAAYDRTGATVWKHENLSAGGIRLKSCDGGIITAEIEYDYEGQWRTARLSAADGTDLDRKSLLSESVPTDHGPKRCPSCKLENPPSALYCDCGYEFVPGSKVYDPESLRLASRNDHLLRSTSFRRGRLVQSQAS